MVLSLAVALGLYEASVLVSQMTREEMREAVKDPDYLTLVVLYDAEGSNSQLVAPIMEKVAENYNHFMRFIAIDCTTDYKTCPEDIRERLPALSVYIPEGLNPYTGQPWVRTEVYKGAISPRELSEFLLDHMPFLGEKLTTDTAKYFFDDTEIPKIVLFTNKSSISPLFRGVASKYRGRADFAVVWHNQTETLAKYHVNSFPTILAINHEGAHTYMGESHFNAVCSFIEPYASTTRRPQKLRAKPQEGTGDSKPLPRFPTVEVTEDSFEAALEDNKQMAIVMFHTEESHQAWPQLVETLQGIAHFIDVKCGLSFSKRYSVTKLPTIRLFPANRKRKSYELNLDEVESEIWKELKGSVEPVNDHSLNAFVERMTEDKTIGCLYLSDHPVSFTIKALASDPFFSETFAFAHYNKGNKAVLASLHAKKYPTFVCFAMIDEKADMRVMEFEGDLGSYPRLYQFLDEVVLAKLAKLLPVRPDREQEDVEEWGDDSFDSRCTKKSGICVLAFFDGAMVFPT